MNHRKTLLLFFGAALFSYGCQTPLSPKKRAKAISEMTPHYECILYHDQAGNQEAVTESIDRGASIGEQYDLPPNYIMAVYGAVKTEQERKVLQQAHEYSSTRDGALPRISGLPPVPTPEEEKRAWETLYGDQC